MSLPGSCWAHRFDDHCRGPRVTALNASEVTSLVGSLREHASGAHHVAVDHPDQGPLYLVWRKRGFCLEFGPIDARSEAIIGKLRQGIEAAGYKVEVDTLAGKATYRVVLNSSETIACAVLAKTLGVAFEHGDATVYDVWHSAASR